MMPPRAVTWAMSERLREPMAYADGSPEVLALGKI
jgi:hypothetical protein